MNRIAPTSRAGAAYPRKRAVTACQVCRVRRTKCDRKSPRCSFCEKANVECVLEPAAWSAFDPASLAILERLDAVDKKLDTVQHTISNPEVLATAAAGNQTVNRAASQAAAIEDLTHLLPENLDVILRWPVFRDAPCPIPLGTRLSSTPSPLVTALQPPILGDELDPSATQGYLDAFFTHVHTKNPVLDEPYIRRLVRRVSIDGPGWDSESCLALLVCANGAIIRPFSAASLSGEELATSIGRTLFAAAQKRMGAVVDCAGVVQAQCLFFAGVYLMTALRPFDAWRSFLQGLAVCQSFIFMDPRHGAANSSNTGECGTPAEEGIYWSCWKSERELRGELGLPDFGSGPSLDPPQRFPSLPLTDDEQMLRAWYFYLSEISLWRLQTEAMKDIIACHSQAQNGAPSSEHLLDLSIELSVSYHQQLAAWQNSLPSIVSIAEPSPTDDTDVLKFVLRGRTTYVRELITWSFLVHALHRRELSPAARGLVAQGIEAHLDRLRINGPGFYHRHHGTWLMIKTSARSACILVAAARTAAVRELLPPGWEEAVDATIDMLHFWRMEVEGLEDVGSFLRYLKAELG